MARIDDVREPLLYAREEVPKHVKRAWEGFSDFALKDNVIEVAVGLILAAAFTTLVTSFVSEILLPPLSLLPFMNRNMEEKFAVLKRGPNYYDPDSHQVGYNTLKQAHDDGAVVMAYGTFINNLVSFLGMGLVLYALATVYDWASSDKIIKRTVRCRYCRKSISEKASRCVECTSWQDGREEVRR